MDVKISTVWHFISETVDVIYNFDSKVWRSIFPLLFKPGELTNEYIAGRRVRYLPPFRLYLILSILFFLVATIPEDQEAIDISSLISPPPNLVESTEFVPPIELTEVDCIDIPWKDFLGERIGARALNSCQTAFSDNGVSLIESFLDNLPIMMFFCVPLLAVFMKGLYIFKKRKYVEHLMFLFHTHSFVFALAILTVLIVRVTEPFPEFEDNIGLLLTGIWLYAAIYIYVALGRVYHQGMLMTSIKMLMLFPVYTICLALTFLSGLFLTFITI